MKRMNVVVTAVRARLVDFADRLYGCAHRRMSFPITMRTSLSMEGRQGAQSETYIVCLECGRHFAHETLLPARVEKRGRVSVKALALLLLIGFVAGAEPQAPEAIDDPQAPPLYRISVNVDLVVLHATVRDRKGRVASDLRRQDFDVFEDGIRQSIRLFRHEDIPVTVGLVVDHSTSMRQKLTDVIAAARTFVRCSNEEDEMFVVNFNEHVTLGLPGAIRFTNRANELQFAISRAPAEGQTALYDAVAEALQRLQTGGRDKKVLIVISDGGDNASAHSLADILKLAEESSALVYAIGIFDEENADRNPDVLRRLARATGGESFFPGKLNDVIEICERIARDIRNQYTIGYGSMSAEHPGVYRGIRVVAAVPGQRKLFVRVRSGYIAGEGGPIKNASAK